MVAPAKYLDNANGARVGEIVVMEDEDIRDEIVGTLTSLGCTVRTVERGDDAVELAEHKQARFFILDIRMGEHRKNEGLDALEEIKGIDENIFVAVYSAYPEWHEQQAKNLGADVFQVKSTDVVGDVQAIAARMLPHALDQLKRTEGARLEVDPEDAEYSREFEKNYNAFQELMSDRRSFEENYNYYVAFVDGEMVGKSTERDDLLSFLISRYPDSPKFYALVQARDTYAIEEVPSPLFEEEN